MLDDVGHLVGRRQAIIQVRELMARPEQRGLPRSQDHPVLVFEGGRGSGKSALLTGLATLLDQRVPYALIDFEKSRHAAVPEVLAALAFELSKRCGRYGGLRFPRFAVGQVVMRQDLDRDDRSRAHQQVRTALEKECNLDRVRQILEEAAAGVVASGTVPVPLPPSLARLVPGLVLGWLTRWVPSRRIVLGPFHDWYGHQGRGRTNDALDTLVDLNRWAKHSADEDNRQRIDQLLWDAFVADLRDHFAGGRHAGELSLNCVILLDNADMPLGQRFVNGLAQARRQRVAMGDDTGDPLTAVVTSRGRLLADVPAEGVELAMTNGEVRRRAGHEGGARRWWCRYGLADLTQDEIGIMVSALSLRDGNNQRLTLMVHQLTGGHPASSRLLLDAVAARPDNRDDLTTVLDQPEPVAQSARMTVAERMQRYLLGELPDEVLDDLVTCAGARERQHAVRLATSSTLLDCGQATYTAVIDPVLWPVIAGTGPVLLRRLLLRTLRRRHDGGLPDWSEVFAWHRGQCAARGDETGELYYALANGDLAFVTQRLYEHLGSDEVTSWLELLASVITAPRRPQERDAPVVPMEQMRALIREIDLPSPLVPLASLVTCRWIADDPFSGSRLHGLHRQITADYTALARQFPDGAEQLLFAAGDYQRRAESWT